MSTEYKTVKEAVAAAYAALEAAERLADETGEAFHFSPCYGMGGYYDPGEQNEYTDNSWYPSSVGC